MKRQKPKKYEPEYKKISGKCSDDSGEETELFVRKSTSQEVATIEHNVEKGDTLQALSIRYHCTVSELKRLNHIHNDNEIFAKRLIKVPDKPISSILAGIHSSGRSSPNTISKKETETDLLENKLKDTFLNTPSRLDEKTFNDIIFNSNIVTKVYDTVNDDVIEGINDEEINLLPKQIVKEPVVVSKLSCNGADADISWITLTVCIVIIIFAIPLVYIFYIAEHPEQFHHSHHNQ